MSMSDCSKCWNTPCTCGWDYRNWSEECLKQHIETLHKVLLWKKIHSSAKLSGIGRPETEDDLAFMYDIGIKIRL